MKKLTNKKYWNKNYDGTINVFIQKATKLSSKSFYFYDLRKKIEKYLKKKSKIMEIGCAPGNILISLSKKYDLIPHGVEYSKEGAEITKRNFEKENFETKNVLLADFFSEKFQNKNKEKYDVVCSFGFIEHFKDVKNVVKLHLDLLKKEGTLIIGIPNLSKQSNIFLEKEIIDKHNLNIMDIKKLKQIMPKNVQIKKCCYYGGPFNIGHYKYENKILEILKTIFFIFQRAILDPLFYLLSLIKIYLNNKYFSPGIVLVCVKK
ncbi:class I SAM-dependent methyltransferase [Candidatus Woesearchaeota archaeon]|nr:class I SAM-dependent methyltransferase [Candidatus Woesearchaeota archaeon]